MNADNALPSLAEAEQKLSELLAVKQLLKATQQSPEVVDFLIKIEQVEAQAKELFEIPAIVNEFNTHFNTLGWHAHDSLPTDVMQEANLLARDSEIDKAEELISKSYIERFDSYFIALRGLPTYFEREHIFERAKERFFQEDYISCIPLILMMIDGVSNDVLNKGVFSCGVDCSAWDCLATINSDIEKFVSIISSARTKTTTEKIEVPYRNGILHGRDIGYGTKLTAIKAWAFLFVTRDILIKKINEPVEKSKFEKQQQKKLDDFLSFLSNPTVYLTNNIEQLESFQNWTPMRTSDEWNNILKTDCLVDHCPDSPEYCLVSFLTAWKDENYGTMATLIHRKEDLSIGKLAGTLRSGLQSKKLTGFSIGFIQEERSGIVFGVTLQLKEGNNEEWGQDICFILHNYIGDERNFINGRVGVWRIYDIIISILCSSLSKNRPTMSVTS